MLLSIFPSEQRILLLFIKLPLLVLDIDLQELVTDTIEARFDPFQLDLVGRVETDDGFPFRMEGCPLVSIEDEVSSFLHFTETDVEGVADLIIIGDVLQVLGTH